MTSELEKLAAMAAQIWSPEAVFADEIGFALEFDETVLSFFAQDDESGISYCRACITSLGGRKCPSAMAEAALAGNFFWSGTNGATLSYNKEDKAFYLTDRFEDGAFVEEDVFEAYVNGFLRNLQDWRDRFSVYLPDIDVEEDQEEAR